MYAYDEKRTTLSINATDFKRMAKVSERAVVKSAILHKDADGSITWVDVIFEHNSKDHPVSKIR